MEDIKRTEKALSFVFEKQNQTWGLPAKAHWDAEWHRFEFELRDLKRELDNTPETPEERMEREAREVEERRQATLDAERRAAERKAEIKVKYPQLVEKFDNLSVKPIGTSKEFDDLVLEFRAMSEYERAKEYADACKVWSENRRKAELATEDLKRMTRPVIIIALGVFALILSMSSMVVFNVAGMGANGHWGAVIFSLLFGITSIVLRSKWFRYSGKGRGFATFGVVLSSISFPFLLMVSCMSCQEAMMW